MAKLSRSSIKLSNLSKSKSGSEFVFSHIGYIILGLLLLLVILLAIPSVRDAIFGNISKLFEKLRYG